MLSKAGRDKGRKMAVTCVEGEYAYLADGKLRKAASPKKKKQKHLQLTSQFIENMQEILLSGSADAQIRRILASDTERISKEGE